MGKADSKDELNAGVSPAVAGEAGAIDAAGRPGTVNSLTQDLRSVGVADGMTLLVHSSMSALGWVAGGPQAAIEALLAAVGDDGTLVIIGLQKFMMPKDFQKNPGATAVAWGFDSKTGELLPARLYIRSASGKWHHATSAHPSVNAVP